MPAVPTALAVGGADALLATVARDGDVASRSGPSLELGLDGAVVDGLAHEVKGEGGPAELTRDEDQHNEEPEQHKQGEGSPEEGSCAVAEGRSSRFNEEVQADDDELRI